MSVFVIKIIACISMFIDHTRFIFGKENIINGYIGRIAFPLYAFLIAEGYTHTKSFALYLGRMLLFAAISQLPAYLLFKPFLHGEPYLNIFFTLTLGLIAIRFYDRAKNKSLSIIGVLLISVIADFIHADYGMLGVLLIASFYILRNDKKIMMVVASLILLLNNLLNVTSFTANNIIQIKHYLTLTAFAVTSLILVAFYNGKLGKSNKYIKFAFYTFYPIHLFIFWFIRIIFV